MASKTTAIKAQFGYNLMQVYWLCKIDRERLTIFMDSLLSDWLTHYYPDWTADEWKQSRLLLNWWTHNWYLRDEWILGIVYDEFPVHRLPLYRQMHQHIFDDVRPDAVQMRQDFAALIPEFTSEIIKAEKAKKEVVV